MTANKWDSPIAIGGKQYIGARGHTITFKGDMYWCDQVVASVVAEIDGREAVDGEPAPDLWTFEHGVEWGWPVA